MVCLLPVWGVLLYGACGGQVWAQNALQLSNLRNKTITVQSGTTVFDTLSVAPGTVQVRYASGGQTVATTAYAVDFAQAAITWFSAPPTDSVTLTYRVLPVMLGKPLRNKDTLSVIPLAEQPAGYLEYQIRNRQTTPDIFNLGGMDYSGSFGRGITIGSNQDATVNSNFNLQMNGKLPGGIEITAALMDNNVPFQPEGNTQQIQEFDRIYIQLQKNRHKLLLGDYDLRSTAANSYFMQYARRLQGISGASGIDVGKKGNSISASAAGAVARGNFQRMVINGIEGNQGPYRLTGANGETFIIVLSASERVFIDGKLLARGADNDYVIDYNTAEITFTPQQIINKDKRITLEFQYTNQTYLRSLMQASGGATVGKTTCRVQFFSEQDAKNQLLTDPTLPDNYVNILKSVGNNVDNAILPGWNNTGFLPDRTMYRLTDTLVNGMVYDSVFVYSVNPQLAVYAVNFSFVGTGKGNYILSDGNINGRVFEWIAPDSLTNTPKGNYAPVTKIITPKKRQMLMAAADFMPSKQQKISVEVALSNNDVNTFSDIGNSQNRGIAARTGYTNTFLPGGNSNLQLVTSANYEFVQQQFTFIEPYREVEFARNWSTAANAQPATEHLANASAQLKMGKNTDLGYRFGVFVRGGNQYKGAMHSINARYRSKNGLNAVFNLSYLNANAATGENSRFLRPNAELSKTMGKKKWQMGIKAEQERNRITSSDTLSANSFYYNQTELFVKTPDSTANRLLFSFIKRWDYAPAQGGKFTLANTGNTANLNGGFTKNPNRQFTYNFTWRNLLVADTSKIKATPLQTLLGEVNYLESVGKGWLRSTTQYQIGAGQRQQTEYFYEKVSNGAGNFVWYDDGDGIEEVEEFQPATENNLVDALYIRILLPTGQYRQTNIVQFTQALLLTPKAVWFNQTGVKKFISLFSTQSTLSVRRESGQRNWSSYLPFGNTTQTDVLAESTNVQNAVFVNRNSPKWEVNVQQVYLVNTNLLLNGTDRRLKQEWKPAMRFGLSNKLAARLSGSRGQLTGVSEAFTSQNYQIRYWNLEPAADLTLNKKFRLTGSFTYKYSADYQTEPLLPAKQQKLTLDTQLGSAIKSNVTVRVSYVQIAYKGAVNTPAAYNLLDGLQPGGNYLWSLNYNTRLANNMQLNFGYDGRKTAQNRINHTGRVTVQAIF